MNAGGSHGTAYHSNYDNVQWYQKVVGDDYEPALMLTRVLNEQLIRYAGHRTRNGSIIGDPRQTELTAVGKASESREPCGRRRPWWRRSST